MTSELPVVKFEGKEYLFVGKEDKTEGALATEEQFRNFVPSYAYMREGLVKRHGVVIGKESDVEFTGEIKTVEMDDAEAKHAIANAISSFFGFEVSLDDDDLDEDFSDE